jgi:hypothetical protein
LPLPHNGSSSSSSHSAAAAAVTYPCWRTMTRCCVTCRLLAAATLSGLTGLPLSWLDCMQLDWWAGAGR